jgi:hypothetical protein
MNSNGTFDPARSKDVLDATVFANGFTYCIDFAGIDFPTTAAKIVQATLTTQGGNDPGEIVAGVNGCSNADVANGDVYVHTSNSAGAGAGQEFDLLIVTP